MSISFLTLSSLPSPNEIEKRYTPYPGIGIGIGVGVSVRVGTGKSVNQYVYYGDLAPQAHKHNTVTKHDSHQRLVQLFISGYILIIHISVSLYKDIYKRASPPLTFVLDFWPRTYMRY